MAERFVRPGQKHTFKEPLNSEVRNIWSALKRAVLDPWRTFPHADGLYIQKYSGNDKYHISKMLIDDSGNVDTAGDVNQYFHQRFYVWTLAGVTVLGTPQDIMNIPYACTLVSVDASCCACSAGILNPHVDVYDQATGASVLDSTIRLVSPLTNYQGTVTDTTISYSRGDLFTLRTNVPAGGNLDKCSVDLLFKISTNTLKDRGMDA